MSRRGFSSDRRRGGQTEDAVPDRDNSAMTGAVKIDNVWSLRTSLEVKERVASLSGAPAAQGSPGHWSSIPPCHNLSPLSEPEL